MDLDSIYYIIVAEGLFLSAVEWLLDHLPLVGMLIFMAYMNYVQEKNKTRKKYPPIKRPQPKPTQAKAEKKEENIGFEIPPLKGAPQEEPQDGIYREQQSADSLAIEAEELADEQNRYMKYLKEKTEQEKRTRQEEEETYRTQAKLAPQKQKPLVIPSVTPQALATGIIYEEILGKPKALRGRNRISMARRR